VGGSASAPPRSLIGSTTASSLAKRSTAGHRVFDPSQPGPFYENFTVGATLPTLPPITLSEADSVLYRATTGDQHRLAADQVAYAAVSGSWGRLANPAMVMQYSIGHSAAATRQVIANSYYRSLRFLRPVEIGETLRTSTTVLGLFDATPRGDEYRGRVWLSVVTSGADGPVLEYERCALVGARESLQGGPRRHDSWPARADHARVVH
jgi:2-methylfumaryl-CoA hydratase